MAVREGNDILGINACNGTITPIRYMRDPDTPEGKAIIRGSGNSYRVGSFLFEFNDFSSLVCSVTWVPPLLEFLGVRHRASTLKESIAREFVGAS